MVCEYITGFCCSNKETKNEERSANPAQGWIVHILGHQEGTWIYLAVGGELVKVLGTKVM